MSKLQEQQIKERKAQIPNIHQANYDKAMKGRSLKSATKAFCLECVSWQKEEVRLCTDFACPLHPYRPYKENSKKASQGLGFMTKSTNSAK